MKVFNVVQENIKKFNLSTLKIILGIFVGFSMMYLSFFAVSEFCLYLSKSLVLDIRQIIIVLFFLFIVVRFYYGIVKLYSMFIEPEIPAFFSWITSLFISFKPIVAYIKKNGILDENYIKALSPFLFLIVIVICIKVAHKIYQRQLDKIDDEDIY